MIGILETAASVIMGILLVIVGILIGVLLILVFWLIYDILGDIRKSAGTQKIQYVIIRYFNEDDELVTKEGWVTSCGQWNNMYYFHWYHTDDTTVTTENNRLEIPTHEIHKVHRGEWTKIEKGGPVPY